MNFLRLIDKSRSIYEGFNLLHKNMHLLDILLSNLYNSSKSWNSMYELTISNSQLNNKFLEISETLMKFEYLKNTVKRSQHHWLSPMTIFYYRPVEESDYATSLNTIENWFNNNFPVESYPRNKVIKLYVPILKVENTTKREVQEFELLTYRNDGQEWTLVDNDYRPRGC